MISSTLAEFSSSTEGGKLAGSVVLRGNEAAPVSVRLGPWGSFTGRLVGEDGVPLAGGLTIFSTRENDRSQLDRGPLPSTDATVGVDGSFRLEGFIPGLLYQAVLARGNDLGESLFENLTAEAGETRKLGDLVVKPFGDH